MVHNRSSSTKVFVDRAVAGCQQALDRLLEAHWIRLESLVRLRMGALLRARMEAEDIVQETCCEAVRSIQKFHWSGQGSFFSWLGGIAEHVIQNHARKLKTKKRSGERIVDAKSLRLEEDGGKRWRREAGGDTDSPLVSLLREERFLRLQKAFDSIPEDYREVILLARVRGLSLGEVGQIMKRTPPAVSMLMFRALRSLRAAFGDTGSYTLPPWPLDCPDGSGSDDGTGSAEQERA